MRLVFLRSAEGDLRWFRQYYENVFPDGGRRAWRQYAKAARRLVSLPLLGHPSDGKGIREYAIGGLPFSFIYRVVDDRIEILRLWTSGRSVAMTGSIARL